MTQSSACSAEIPQKSKERIGGDIMEKYEKIAEALRNGGQSKEGVSRAEAADTIQELIGVVRAKEDLLKVLRKQVDERSNEAERLLKDKTMLETEVACLRNERERVDAALDAVKWCVQVMCGGGDGPC